MTSFSAPVYIFIRKNYLLLDYIRLLILTYRTFNRNLIILGPNCRFHERKSEKSEICDFTLCQTFFVLHLNFFPPTCFYLCHKTLTVTLSCSGECSRVCAGCRPGARKLIRLWSSWMHTPHAHSLSHFCAFKGRLLPSTSPSKFSFSSCNIRLFFSCFGFFHKYIPAVSIFRKLLVCASYPCGPQKEFTTDFQVKLELDFDYQPTCLLIS